MQATQDQKRAIGYTRVSTDGQADGHSLEHQTAEIERYCRDNNLKLVATFSEIESAATIKKRPAFKEAVRILNADQADYLVCTNLDRFSRNLLDFELIRRSLERKGKAILSTQQSFLTPIKKSKDFDFRLQAQAQREMIEAEVERWKIRERCLGGRYRKVSQGGWVGHRPLYEFDVKQGELVLNAERFKTVKMVLRLAIRLRKLGFTYSGIGRYLSGANNLLNPDGTRGRIFPRLSQREILRKRRVPLAKGDGPTWVQSTVFKLIHGYGTRRALWAQATSETKSA